MNIQQSNLARTLPSIGKEYKISFDLLVSKHKPADTRNVLHFTTGGNHGRYGDRIPGIWIWNNKLQIASALNGNHNSYVNLPTEVGEGKWNKLQISQSLIDSKVWGAISDFFFESNMRSNHY